MIEVIINDRMGRKVRVKCKYVSSLPIGRVRLFHAYCIRDTDPLFFASVLICAFHDEILLLCSASDTIGELKMILACQIGTRPEKIRLQKWNIIYKDHITLDDYEVKDGSGIELYYN